jgi:hypothetical protein
LEKLAKMCLDTFFGPGPEMGLSKYCVSAAFWHAAVVMRHDFLGANQKHVIRWQLGSIVLRMHDYLIIINIIQNIIND